MNLWKSCHWDVEMHLHYQSWKFKAWTYMEIKKTYLFQYNIYKIKGGFR